MKKIRRIQKRVFVKTDINSQWFPPEARKRFEIALQLSPAPLRLLLCKGLYSARGKDLQALFNICKLMARASLRPIIQ